MALNKVEERIPARMPHEVYERIAAAAQAIGATLSPVRLGQRQRYP